MDKLNKKKHLWLAASFAASLAAISCTSNHNLGNGTPTRSGPDVRTAPTSGVTTGGETYTPPMPPPMMSSYAPSIRRSPDEAAAIMAQHQANRGVYLGVTNPGPNRPVVVAQSGQFVNPAMLVNPQATVNSSISSQPTPVISSGAGEAPGADPTGGEAAAIFAEPETATSRVSPVTVASSTVRTTATTTPTTAFSSVSAPLRVTRAANGTVTVTNVGTARSTSRNQ
ncbi:MAG TPA: hypothetical protein VGQ36_22765 [Thermoanaerobaculia bacterium]|jgi:hypothetical protein|nr:hypothetical protein [Thermoanaerobaculia bacterium]